jgi:hypothetical protein
MSVPPRSTVTGSPAGAIDVRADPAQPSTAVLGDAAVIVWNDVSDEGRSRFYAWHDREHIPERLAIPGFRRGRRYIRPGHSPEWLTLYEASDLAVVTSPAYLARLNAPTAATRATLPYFRNTSRAVCRLAASMGSSSGGHVLALRIDAAPAAAAALQSTLASRILPRRMQESGIVACHLYAADVGASHTDTAESRTRTFDVPAWVVLVEATTAAAAARARAAFDDRELTALGAVIRADGAVYALEICRLPMPAGEDWRDATAMNPIVAGDGACESTN